MVSLLSAELTATCSALGYFDEAENKYYAQSGNTLETVKDLIRYLKRDDETHDIRRHLGDTQVLQTDLLPLLKNYWKDTDLFDVLLRLIVNLTTPPLILWQEELPSEKTERKHFLKIEEHLCSYKQAFADEQVWAVLDKRLRNMFAIESVERSYEDGLIIERILILIRNVLYVPSDPDVEMRPDNDASVHDQVLWALHKSEILDSVLFMANTEDLQVYYMHILEILYFMLREQNASELASTALQRSQTEKIRDEAELLGARHRETTQKQEKVKKYMSTRHSRFGGTFIVQSVKSIGDNDLICHKPINRLDAIKFDVDKKKPKTPKNRLPVQSKTLERRSAFPIRLFLKVLSVEFLNGSYNPFMKCINGNLARAKSQAHDESYYLWALRFFMEFNRCYKFEVKLVSETVSVDAFHFVQKQIEDYFGYICTDKKKVHLWARRLHLAVLAYRELLLTLGAMDKSTDEGVRNSARVIKSRIFYVLEYRELILTLLITFDELKMSQLYLNDLIETQHIFLKMLQTFCGKDGSVIVQKKSKARKRKKKAAAIPAVAPEMNLEVLWDEASPQLSTVLGETIDFPADVVPFDATSEVPIDEQKTDAMKQIQRKLRNGEFELAIGLLRASREVWPENDIFGAANMVVEEEFLALQDIFFADLGENLVQPPPVAPAVEQDEEESEDEEEDVGGENYEESDFKLEDFIKRLAHPKIVRACSLALSNFQHNSVNTNLCVVKLLHRIAFDCKMYVMVFQASIFRTFQKIYSEKAMPQYKELVRFASYIMRQFFKVAKTNPKVYMEALFWKSSKDVIDIEEGYGSYQEKSAAAARGWSEIEEDELRRLFMEHQEKQLQDDVVDWILNNLINNMRTRRGVLKKLKDMYLLTDYKGPRKSVSSRAPQQWTDEEETQLAELYEQFKEASDPLGCILSRLETRRSKNKVVEKLLLMGLIQDKKELRKKRVKKSQQSRANSNPNDSDIVSDSSDSDSDSDQGSDTSSVQKKKQQHQPRNRNPTSNSKKSKTSRKPPSQIKPVSTKEITKHLLSVLNLGMSEALEWLRESFEDACEDMSDTVGEDESIPIVPILNHSVEAIENTTFQLLLKAFGITPPFDEQETYWRIPTTATSHLLRSYCDLLLKALNGTLTTVQEQVNNDDSVANGNESSDDDVFEKLRKYHTERMEENFELNEVQSDREDVSNVNEETSVKNLQKKNKKRRVVMSDDSDTENTANFFDETEPDPDVQNSEPAPNGSKFLDSDEDNIHETVVQKKNVRKFSDSEDDTISNVKVSQTSKISKPSITSDSDTDDDRNTSQNNKRSKPSVTSDSDTENDDRNTLQNNKKSKPSLSTDSDDNDREKSNQIDNDETSPNSKRSRSITPEISETIKPQKKRTRVIVSDDEE